MNNFKYTIDKITLTTCSVDIVWNDKKISHFHYLWLRDNCPSSFHKNTRMRKFNILDVSENIKPDKAYINNDGNLKIQWNENKHESIFQSIWLRENCYTLKNKKKYISPYNLWDASLKKNISKVFFNYNKIIESDEILLNWLEILDTYGICVLKNCPTTKNSAFKLLNRVSHVRETFFGTPFEVINIPKPNNQAYTSDALTNHTDLPYYEYAPGYQFLHCLINNTKGGISSCLDSFKIANILKEKNSDLFEILTNTPVKFIDNDYTQDKTRIHYSPIINLSHNGDFNDIRFNMGAMGTIDLKPNLMVDFYRAYRAFASLVNNNKFILKFKLKAGEILCFNNRRILHGRSKFDPNSGKRHLQGYYLDRDEILSRLNFLKKINI